MATFVSPVARHKLREGENGRSEQSDGRSEGGHSRMSEIASRNAAADNIVIMMNILVWSDTDTTEFSGFQKTH